MNEHESKCVTSLGLLFSLVACVSIAPIVGAVIGFAVVMPILVAIWC